MKIYKYFFLDANGMAFRGFFLVINRHRFSDTMTHQKTLVYGVLDHVYTDGTY